MKRLVMALMTVCSVTVFAMPTRTELSKAQPLVVELMAPATEAFKNASAKDKAAAAVKVGDVSSEFAKSAETEAAKFLLLKGAVSFYARGEAYDKAADAVVELQRSVKDVTPSLIADITGGAAGKISEAKAPRLYEMFRRAKLQVRATEEAKTLASKLRKMKSDALQRRYAEALAISGDWKSAYREFLKLSDGAMKNVVEAEANGKAKNAETGGFWWEYKPAMEDAEDIFKEHAAEFYRKALAAGEITGLKKNIVEQRISGFGGIAANGSLVDTVTAVEKISSEPASSPSSNKTWQENGNTAWLALPNGEKLEFAKCPAGNGPVIYCWNDEHMAKGGHKFFNAKVSRPYWIMKRPLCGKDLKGLAFAGALQGEDGEFIERARDNVDCFCESLTAVVRDSLPCGYVVRLPSIVEYQYAFTEGGKAKTHPYDCLTRYGYWDKEAKPWYAEIGIPAEGGQSRANGWGISHWALHEQVLDRVLDDNGKFNDKHQLVLSLNKPAAEADTLWWGEVAGGADIDHNGQVIASTCLGGHLITGGTKGTKPGVSRLVVGPDLVGEWKSRRTKK